MATLQTGFYERILSYILRVNFSLVEMPGSNIVKLSIAVSMRQSKKFVTRVRGLEDYGIGAPPPGAVETSASSGRAGLRRNHVELVFLGNITDEIETLFVDEIMSKYGGVKGSEYSVPKQVGTKSKERSEERRRFKEVTIQRVLYLLQYFCVDTFAFDRRALSIVYRTVPYRTSYEYTY
jgi:hypothetical protein